MELMFAITTFALMVSLVYIILLRRKNDVLRSAIQDKQKWIGLYEYLEEQLTEALETAREEVHLLEGSRNCQHVSR